MSQVETSLRVPIELAAKCRGVALDMGGSMIKIIYRGSDDSMDLKNKITSFAYLQLISFPQSKFEEALDYIASLQSHNKVAQQEYIYATGIGCSANAKRISDKLNVGLKNIFEIECVAKSFMYLSAHLPRQDLLEPYDVAAGMQRLQNLEFTITILKHMVVQRDGESEVDFESLRDPESSLGRMINDSPLPASISETNYYPCLLVCCGSGLVFTKINADGTYKLLEVVTMGGKTFSGLGSMLTGCETFPELVELASLGNQRHVDTFTDSLFPKETLSNGENTMYSALREQSYPLLIQCFGKCVGAQSGNFKKEDIAMSLLNHTVLEIVHMTCLTAALAGTKRVFFCGSFVSSRFVRSIITREMVLRNLWSVSLERPSLKFDFVRPGAYLGAIGVAIVQHEEESAVLKSTEGCVKTIHNGTTTEHEVCQQFDICC